MQNSLLKKGLVLGIIVLLITISISPATGIVVKKNTMLEEPQIIIEENSSNKGDGVDWWPMFHHDLQHSGHSTSNAPDTNNFLWSQKIGDEVFSSPAVVDGRVYIGSNDYKVYCLDANTGGYIWSYGTRSWVYSSPAVADGKVYIGSFDDNLYCLDAITGAYIWSYKTNGYLYSSPAVADGKVYIGSATFPPPYNDDNKVYCLNANTGAYIWSYKTGFSVESSPAVVDGKVYFGSNSGRVYCLDAITGDYIWGYSTGAGVEDSSPAVVDGKVYIGSNDNKVYCLDAITGAYIWSYTIGDLVRSSPAVADGKVYIGSFKEPWASASYVYCLDANTGGYIWSYKAGNWVFSSPAVADGKVFFSSFDRNVYCVNSTTGAYIWSYEIGSSKSSPAVVDGKVYIGSTSGKIYAFGELDPDAPSAPEIVGPTKGAPDVLYNFTFKAESPLGNDLFYWIEWADGNNSGWLGPYDSGVEITESHVWDVKGVYPIQAKAKDTNGLVSSWGILRVKIPRNKATYNSLFLRFLEHFPLLERLLSLITYENTSMS